MALTLRRVNGAKHYETLYSLHELTFPGDEHVDYSQGLWWMVFDQGEPVAFAGLRLLDEEPHAAYMNRCGVLSTHHGHRLQVRLVSARLRFARRLGLKVVITTTYENPRSSNNLIRAGFRMYWPPTQWGAAGTNYWQRQLPS